MPCMGVKYKEILPVSNSGDLRGILGGVNPSPCSQNQMYDLPPRERNLLLDTEQKIGRMGHYPAFNAAGMLLKYRCLHMCISAWSYSLGVPGKSLVLVGSGQ